MARKTQLVKLFLAVLILAILILKIGIEEIISTLATFNIIWIIPLFLINGISHVLGAINIQILLRGSKKVMHFGEVLKKYLLSSAIGSITPGRLGEFSLLYFFKNNITPGITAAIMILDKIITILVLLVLSAWGLFVFIEYTIAVKILGIYILGIIIAGLLFFSKTGIRLLKKMATKKISDNAKGFSKTLNELIKERKGYIAYNTFITIIKWMLHFIVYYLTFFALGVKLPLFALLLFATVTLISFIPITFAGLGLREGAGVYIFSLIGIPFEIIISAFLAVLVVKYLTNVSIMLYLAKERDV